MLCVSPMIVPSWRSKIPGNCDRYYPVFPKAIAGIAGPFTSGVFFEKIDPAAPFIASALIFGTQLILGWILLRRSNLSNAISKRRQRKLKRLFQMLD